MTESSNTILSNYLQYFHELGINDVVIPSLPEAQPPAERLEALFRNEVDGCTRCRLHEGRRNIVFGTGSPEADLMFVGEGPGGDEDRQGLPFVGRAGQMLTRIIEAMHFTREQVYIANIVKCRPPKNRTPKKDEVACCEGFLLEQIAIIEPKVICALGTPAAQTLLQTDMGISQLRGRFHPFGDSLLMPTFHPAYLLRNPEKKKDVWEDMQKVMAQLKAEA